MIKGIDVSGWNRADACKGQTFVMIKATEGVGFVSDMVETHYNSYIQGKAATDRLFGFYHYARPDLGNTAVQEANHFVNSISKYTGSCTLALDWEGAAVTYPPEWCLDFLDAVKRFTGSTPLLYISADMENSGRYNLIEKAGYPLWVAHWGVSSPTLKNWKSWTLWQYTDSLVLPTGEKVDGDYLTSTADWWKMVKGTDTTPNDQTDGWNVLGNKDGVITLENQGLKITMERVLHA